MSFQAGLREPQPFALRMNLYRAGFNETRATLLARYVEFWCQKNCVGGWQIAQSSALLSVSFSSSLDVVLFMISEEYGYFVPAATTRPRS
ncbi:MAG: hypothetical protein EOO77_29390, partial [Oxalobacteraceae bacterium]